MNKIHLLIEQLSKELKPVKTKSWKIPCFVWCFLFVILLIGNYFFSLFLGIGKKDIFELLSSYVFLLGIMTFISSFLYVMFLSLPGRNYHIWKKISFFVFSLWSISIVIDLLNNQRFDLEFFDVFLCNISTIILSVILVFLVVYFAKKRFVLDWDSVIIGSILTSSVSSTLCLSFMCQDDTVSHTFFGHYLPVIMLYVIVRIGIFIKNKYF